MLTSCWPNLLSETPTNTREAIHAAAEAGALLKTVAATPYDEFDSIADLLSALHNKGKIDLLIACDKPGLDGIPSRSFFCLLQVFCRTLPRLHSSTKCAIAACERMFDRAGADLAASLVFDALVQWLQQSAERVAQALELIDQDAQPSAAVVRSVLLGGASQDAAKSTNDALDLSNRTSSTIRLPALWALARTLPDDDEDLLVRTLQRLTAVVTDPLSERDTAAAVDSALHLYRRMGTRVRGSVQSVVTNACRTPSPALRQALAYGLAAGDTGYSDTVIDECLSALRHTQADETDTLRALDSVLYGWDLDGDRERILQLLVNLLTPEDSTFDFGSLDSLQHKLREASGDILGWYVVSLLLTGHRAVCDVVFGLLPHAGEPAGLDIDLRPFSLSPCRILFLARKILGYCLLKKGSAAALLLSCLRVVPAQDQQELEDLVLEHLLMNYPSAIDCLTTATPRGDTAKGSVDRLSKRLRTYVADLERSGICLAFAPTERQRQIRLYSIGDLFRGAHKRAQQDSALLQMIPKAVLLYGTGSIVYVHRDPASGPVRQEMAMSTFRHEVEIPRLQEIDPLGLQRDIQRFRVEPKPE